MSGVGATEARRCGGDVSRPAPRPCPAEPTVRCCMVAGSDSVGRPPQLASWLRDLDDPRCPIRGGSPRFTRWSGGEEAAARDGDDPEAVGFDLFPFCFGDGVAVDGAADGFRERCGGGWREDGGAESGANGGGRGGTRRQVCAARFACSPAVVDGFADSAAPGGVHRPLRRCRPGTSLPTRALTPLGWRDPARRSGLADVVGSVVPSGLVMDGPTDAVPECGGFGGGGR